MSKTSIACIALYKDKVLIAHRISKGDMAGRWEFPGGKVEDNESEEQAVVREFKEEFNVKVKVGELIATGEFEHRGEKRHLHAYRIFVPHKGLIFKYKLTEHTEYKWVKFEEIKNLEFVDSDLLIYEKVKEYANSQNKKIKR